ncbi:MAG TPA: glycerophosphodiester phosphodiesterase family protein, partial [Myxococcus sp.]|nr:glycerophosphodiester phosphodiesterase family protein [Myxococcus sp.]
MPLENTLASFGRAFDEGADFVELDVVRTADDVLVVLHSNELADHVRPPWPRRYVGELTHEELSKLRTGVEESGRRGEVPTLASVLDLARERHARRGGAGVVLNIEI